MVDMFDSVKYNLTNPALTDDIGESLGTGTTMPMAPSTMDGSGMYFPGITGSMNGITIQGNLKGDKVELSQKEKDSKTWKNIFKGVAAIGGCVLLWKGGKKIAPKLKSGFSKAWSGIKVGCGKVLSGIKALGSKIKSVFKK